MLRLACECQQRPTIGAKETYYRGKRDLAEVIINRLAVRTVVAEAGMRACIPNTCQKRPTIGAKETYCARTFESLPGMRACIPVPNMQPYYRVRVAYEVFHVPDAPPEEGVGRHEKG